MIAPRAAAEVDGEHAGRRGGDDVVVDAVADVGDLARARGRSPSTTRAKNAGSGLATPQSAEVATRSPVATSPASEPRRPRAGCRRSRPARRPRAAAPARPRRPGRRRRAPRGAGRPPRAARRTRAADRSPGRHSSSAWTCGWRPATVAPIAANSSWRVTPIQSAHTPQARSSLSSVSPKSKTAARSLTARAAPADGGVGALGVGVGPAPLHAVVDHERVAAVVLDALDVDAHDRDPLALVDHRRAADRRQRHVPGGEHRERAARVRRAAAPATPAAAPARARAPAARAGPRWRPGSRAARPPPVERTATCRAATSGKLVHRPARLPPASDLALEQAVRALELLVGRLVDRRGADVAVDAGVDRAVRLAGAAGDRGDQRVTLGAQALAPLERGLGLGAAPRRPGVVVNAASAGETAAARARRTAAARRRAAWSAGRPRRGGRSTTARGTPRRPRRARRARPPARPRARAPARGCAPPRSRPRAASGAGPTAGRRGSSAPWAPACGG